MRALKTIFAGTVALFLSTPMAMAEDSEFFDPNMAPHIDSDNNSFMDALYSLAYICADVEDYEGYLYSICEGAKKALDNTRLDCLDIHDNGAKIVTQCQKADALRLGYQIQQVFNTHLSLDDGGNCTPDSDYQCFTIFEQGIPTTFAFPNRANLSS